MECTDRPFDGYVDDIRVYIHMVEIDGPGGAAATARICLVRNQSHFPVIASIQLDNADLDSHSATTWQYMAQHEFAHVLGFGILWRNLRNPSVRDGQPVDPPPDTHFPGANAVAAFDAAGGASYEGGKVPVENEQGPVASRDTHWRVSEMHGEIMTYNLSGTALSAITIQSMADLGYSVDASAADAYTLTSAQVAQSRPARVGALPLRCGIGLMPVAHFVPASSTIPVSHLVTKPLDAGP